MSPATSPCLRRILLTGALVLLAAPRAVAGQVWGDVTRDGTINSADALSVLSYSVGLPAPDHDYGLADVSAEGTISTLDALIILQYTVGMDLPQFRVGQPAGDDGCPEGDDCVIPAEATVFDLAANVAYDNDHAEQRLDVYTPPGAGPFPVVLVLHGGAWRAGSENDADVVRFAKQVVTLGYAAVSVQYRLANSADRRWPAQIHDVRCAVRWIRSNAATHRLDPTRIVAAGNSSGGHLASHLAVSQGVDSLSGACPQPNPDYSVDGAISLYGPMNLEAPTHFITAATNLLGCSPETCPAKAREASPFRYVDPGDRPHVLSHGRNDGTVGVEESRLMNTTLKAAGVEVAFYEPCCPGHAYDYLDGGATLLEASCGTLRFLAVQFGATPPACG